MALDIKTSYIPSEAQYYKTVGYHWLYSSPSGGWWHYSKEDNEQLEDAYESDEDIVSLVIGNNSYACDLKDMLQVKVTDGKKSLRNVRYIKRVESLDDVELRGVAGKSL